MNNLEQLVKNYKQTKLQPIMTEIYKQLNSLIKKKSKFIFERKFYPRSLYYKCKECRMCQETDRFICNQCEKCTCVKGFFNLKRDSLCDYEDVENDLWVEILRIIENYNIEKNFDTYLYACLWEWMPSFLTKNFVKSLQNKSLSFLDEDSQESIIDLPDEHSEKKINNDLTATSILTICKTSLEKKIISILLKNKEISQEKIAEKVGITQQSVSRIIKRIKRKLKNKV